METLYRKLTIGGRTPSSGGRFVVERTLLLGIVVIVAGALLGLAACLDVVLPVGPDQPQSEQADPPQVSMAERLTALTGRIYYEHDIERMGPHADLLLWRHELIEAEEQLAEVRRRHPDDIARIEDAELEVSAMLRFVEAFETLTSDPPRPFPLHLVGRVTASEDDSSCSDEPEITMTTGSSLSSRKPAVGFHGSRLPRSAVIAPRRTSTTRSGYPSQFATSAPVRPPDTAWATGSPTKAVQQG